MEGKIQSMKMKNMFRSFRPALVLFCLFAIGSCAGSDRDSILKTLEQREKALERKDLNLYLKCISPEYRDAEGHGFERIRERFTEVTRAFESVELIPEKNLVYSDGVTATVIRDFTLRFRPEGEEPFSRRGRERIVLRKEGRSWKIIDGL